MLSSQAKEVLCVFHGFKIHKPEINEACVFVVIITMLCLALNFKLPSPMVWFLIAAFSIAGAVFDAIPPEKPLRTLLIGLITGAILAFIATL